MLIRDLEQLEVVSEETQVEGGWYNNAAATSGALASAYGWNSNTYTNASTITQTTDYSSFSGSGSTSSASSNSYYYYGYYPYYPYYY